VQQHSMLYDLAVICVFCLVRAKEKMVAGNTVLIHGASGAVSRTNKLHIHWWELGESACSRGKRNVLAKVIIFYHSQY